MLVQPPAALPRHPSFRHRPRVVSCVTAAAAAATCSNQINNTSASSATSTQAPMDAGARTPGTRQGQLDLAEEVGMHNLVDLHQGLPCNHRLHTNTTVQRGRCAEKPLHGVLAGRHRQQLASHSNNTRSSSVVLNVRSSCSRQSTAAWRHTAMPACSLLAAARAHTTTRA